MNNIRDINPSDFLNLFSPEKKIKFLLRYAILAPSTHNSQPWLFKIKDNSCEVYYSADLKIPNADPEERDLFISIGCAIENLIIAAKYFNVFDSIHYRLSYNDNLVAEIKFKNLDSNDLKTNLELELLLNTVINRINARGIFRDEPVSQNIIINIFKKISEENEKYEIGGFDINFLKEKEKIEKLAELTGNGIKTAYRSKEFRKEMSKWLRNNFTFKKDGLPGYALKMPALISFFFPTLIRYINIGNKLADLNKRSIKSAPLVCVISAEEIERPLIWIKTGRLVERLMLEFNKEGYNTSIFVASIEMGDVYKKVQQVIDTQKRPQFIFVVGKVDSLHRPTDRFSVESKIIK